MPIQLLVVRNRRGIGMCITNVNSFNLNLGMSSHSIIAGLLLRVQFCAGTSPERFSKPILCGPSNCCWAKSCRPHCRTIGCCIWVRMEWQTIRYRWENCGQWNKPSCLNAFTGQPSKADLPQTQIAMAFIDPIIASQTSLGAILIGIFLCAFHVGTKWTQIKMCSSINANG